MNGLWLLSLREFMVVWLALFAFAMNGLGAWALLSVVGFDVDVCLFFLKFEMDRLLLREFVVVCVVVMSGSSRLFGMTVLAAGGLWLLSLREFMVCLFFLKFEMDRLLLCEFVVVWLVVMSGS